ncbi:hypothetical protein V8F20_004761 [Naviculisporaceae sp. PSN 640]
MESSAPKRRRTSPRAAVHLPAPDNPESTTPKDSPPKPAEGARRPSYASPTRASLQRHNPDILRRRTISPKRKRSDQPDEHVDPDPPTASRPSSADSLSQALAAHLATQTEANDENETGAGPSTAQNKSNEQNTTDISTAPNAGIRSPARRAGSVRNPVPLTARPLPQPLGDDDDDDLFNPFAGRGLARSPGPLAPEPELPPTPERPDPVVSTPPSGIHNTPSKRPKRSKELAQRLKSSSPLKQPALRPSKSQLSKSVEPVEVSASPPPTTAEMRGLPPDDPDAKKKQMRDWLLSRVKDLERDLEMATAENERIQKATVSKNRVSPPPNKQEIIDLLRRHVLPSKERAKYETKNKATVEPPAWLEAALNPIAFLPFGKHTHQPIEDPWAQMHSNDVLATGDKYPKPASHHPLSMTAMESLPYLQLFTPLQFSTVTYPLERQNRSDPIIMRHSTIVLPQGALMGLFTAKIVADVNTKTLAVVALSVDRLDPAAVSELTPFMKSICSLDKPTNSALTNNVSILGWAMAEWLRVAVRRAKFWKILDEELGGSDKDSLIKMVRSLRIGKGKRSGRKEPSLRRRRRQNDDADDRDADDDHEADNTTDVQLGNARASDLSGYMSQTVMDYTIPVLNPAAHDDDNKSTLRIHWRMEFDWTGEARSDISVVAGVPGKWHQFDERGQLVGISKLFDDLLQGGENPLEAVRTVVSLLTGDPGPGVDGEA